MHTAEKIHFLLSYHTKEEIELLNKYHYFQLYPQYLIEYNFKNEKRKHSRNNFNSINIIM